MNSLQATNKNLYVLTFSSKSYILIQTLGKALLFPLDMVSSQMVFDYKLV